MPQESRPKPCPCSKNTKTSDRPQRDHNNNKRNKKERRNCSSCRPRSPGFTPATAVNTTNSLPQNSWNKPPSRDDKYPSQVTCYNYNNKSHFANQCTKPQKPKNYYWFWELPC